MSSPLAKLPLLVVLLVVIAWMFALAVRHQASATADRVLRVASAAALTSVAAGEFSGVDCTRREGFTAEQQAQLASLAWAAAVTPTSAQRRPVPFGFELAVNGCQMTLRASAAAVCVPTARNSCERRIIGWAQPWRAACFNLVVTPPTGCTPTGRSAAAADGGVGLNG